MKTATNFLLFTLSVVSLTLATTADIFSTPLHSTNENLVAFDATIQPHQVKLTWSFNEITEGQTYIQRAGIDMKFETIDSAKALKDGQFQDREPKSGISFYRLATYQADGTIVYHCTITVVH